MPNHLFRFLKYLAHPGECCIEELRHLPTGHQEIYRLCDPRTLATHYVGRSNHPRRRLHGHVQEALECARYNLLEPEEPQAGVLFFNIKKRAWIAELDAQGLRPQLESLEVVETPSHTPLRELRWLLHFWQQGATLYNYETVLPCPTMQVLVQQYPHDLLQEEAGADIWDLLLWAYRDAKYYNPHRYIPALVPDHLPPIEYRDMRQARRERFTIEAWTPHQSIREIEWYQYRALERLEAERELSV